MASKSAGNLASNHASKKTPIESSGAQAPLIINGKAVPTAPRADRVSIKENPLVTPPPGIDSAAPMGRPAVSGPEANTTPTPTGSGFTPRPDRLAEPLSAENAQAVFSPQACIFVANLAGHRSNEELQHSVERRFSSFGVCHAKIGRDKNKMPYAFVQFHEIEHARVAIRNSRGMAINGRTIRAEHANVDRTVLVTRHTGGPVSDEEARGLLGRFGAIEETSPISVADQKVTNLPEGRWVKFAYFQDSRDAQDAFKHNEFYRLLHHRTEEIRAHRYHRQDVQPLRYRLNNPQFCGRPPAYIRNQSHFNPPSVPENLSIFIDHLPHDVTREEIEEVFGRYGIIESLKMRRKLGGNSEVLKVFAFLDYDDPQAVDAALVTNHKIRGHRLRVARKICSQHRNGVLPISPGPTPDPILFHLYNQGLQLGLPQHQASHILTIGERPCVDSPTVSGPLYGYSPYYSQASNVGHPQLPALPPSGHYSQQFVTEAMSSDPPRNMSEGTNWYLEPTQPTQMASYAIPQVMPNGATYYPNPYYFEGLVRSVTDLGMEQVVGVGDTYNYQHGNYAPLHPIQETNEPEHPYSSTSYVPQTHAPEPDHGHGHGHH